MEAWHNAQLSALQLSALQSRMEAVKAADVAFDSNSFPAAQREGHGLRMQSASAFCRKSGAICRFDQSDGWFRLRLVL